MYSQSKRIVTPEAALQRLEGLCARSEHSESELRKRLKVWGVSVADSEAILKSLRENRFVSDERFARAYAVDKLRFSGYGSMKIRMGLIAKGVDRAIIDTAISELDEEEYSRRLDEILAAKARNISDEELATYECRVKLYRFALSRGFESSLISKAVKALVKQRL